MRDLVLGIVVGLLALWLLLLVALVVGARRTGHRVSLRDAVRLVPDVVRLLRRVAADPGVPRRIRVGLWLLLAYVVLPIDVVPDFIPVIGLADEVVVIAFALRYLARRLGPDALARHWPGTPEGLAAVRRLAGV
ncbi:YkvA family protein [Nocardioides caricicola]|uniref:YkvA family protein n=1 Tax=Nocardioides caricicola TaxID=634770 RepID=A0ABW0N903_9ACTN